MGRWGQRSCHDIFKMEINLDTHNSFSQNSYTGWLDGERRWESSSNGPESLQGVALRFHIKVTVSRQATNPEKGSFPLNEVLERTLWDLSRFFWYHSWDAPVMQLWEKLYNNSFNLLWANHTDSIPHPGLSKATEQPRNANKRYWDCECSVSQPIFLGQNVLRAIWEEFWPCLRKGSS